MGVRSRSPLPTGSQYGLSIGATVVTLTVPVAAMCAEIFVRTASIVFSRTSVDPTATQGFQADPGDIIMLNSRAELDRFEAIRQGATSGVLDIEYFTDISG